MQQPNGLKIIIAGGGTGGHIFPAVAVAQALQKIIPNASILFVGAQGKMEMEKIPQAGFEIIGITIAGLNRTNWIKNCTLPFKLIASFFQVRSIVNKFKPDAVFGVGGYSSFPVLKYAQSKGIPTFIHESNAFAGKANKWLGKNATKVYTGTKGMEAFFPIDKIQVTGNPVRKNITDTQYTKEAALLKFGLLSGKKTVLILGGSLGAASINNAVQASLATLASMGVQLIWQTGKPNFSRYSLAAQNYNNVYISSFIDDMSAAYSAADLVVSRSGAMAVAEIALTGKACIFIPYPHAAEDHQTFNAQLLVKEGAALMIQDAAVEAEFLPTIQNLVNNEQLISELSEKIKVFAIRDAAEIIAKDIIHHSLKNL